MEQESELLIWEHRSEHWLALPLWGTEPLQCISILQKSRSVVGLSQGPGGQDPGVAGSTGVLSVWVAAAVLIRCLHKLQNRVDKRKEKCIFSPTKKRNM